MYTQDLFSKTYNFIKLVILIAAQAIPFEIHINGLAMKSAKKGPFSTISFTAYFLMGPIIFFITVISLRTCCRNKDSHPMGSRMTEAAFSSMENARKVCQLVCIMILSTFLAYYQAYLVGLESHLLRQDLTFLRKISIIFAGIFIGLSLLTAYTERFFK